MNTLYDVQQLLKSFGIFIYVGDRIADLELMEAEVKELYHSNLIDVRDYQMAILLLRRELKQQKEKKDE
ncbi:YqgQ family protein [Priestia megaterium]|uniref:YqgQ family protein n=1 Tax=Priestia megaterium TaxID=1404 RepID=UPI0006ABB94C|nr:YqgQ family protein [Priestia megaterium]KOP76475.1 cytosolic protein [Bacillus sp. FJAT-21351]MCJ7984580.1 YqgQ family protein [Priestia sp. OVL9]MEB2263554.1 YqgQ family protein [Priestia megaterium]MED4757718.1 YqgQ family protein [Priestia megaterium]